MANFLDIINYIIKPLKINFKGKTEHKVYNCSSDDSGKTKFFINDPTTKNLIGEMTPPESTVWDINVLGDRGPGFELGSEQQQASACKIVINENLKYLLDIYNNSFPNKKISNWIGTNCIEVHPRAGKQLNAYYDRRSLRFFYVDVKKMNKIVYSCETTPVVTHEFGHAFLDTLRPDLWSTQSIEIWSFHEAFGDICSLTFSLLNDKMILQALEETKGDLLKSNILTRIGAEMGLAYLNLAKNKEGLTGTFLRDLSVFYEYKNPTSLPEKAPDNILANECHSFSRVFSGAFYEILVKISKEILKNDPSKDYLQAIKCSRDVCLSYLIKATVTAPITVDFFDTMAKQILFVDQGEGSKYNEIIKSIFTKRKILKSSIKALESKKINQVQTSLKGLNYETQKFSSFTALRTNSIKTIKLIDERWISSLSTNNHLYGYQIDVPIQKSFYFDERGNLLDVSESDNNSVVESALSCLDFISKNDLFGTHEDAMFYVEENKIVRKKISCKCGLPNHCDPNAPEYNKPWKPQNNSSCCGKTSSSFLKCNCNKNKSQIKNENFCNNCHINYKCC